MTVLQTSLSYAGKNNFSIIPLQKDKKPYLKWAEFQRRRATENEIKTWWYRWPDAMIGIVTGRISKLFVIDCDSQQGFDAVQAFLPDALLIPTARTPRGGWHLYFQYPEESNLTVGAGLMPGVDIRGTGGYITAAPSTNGNGIAYRWLDGLSIADIAPPPLPNALLGAFNTIINNSLYRDEVKTEVSAAGMFANGRRDNDLFHTANCLVKGGMPKEEITQVLEKLIISWGENPDKDWIQAKIESASQRAERKEIHFKQEVQEFILTSNGTFLTSDVINRLQVTSRQEKKNIVNALLRFKNEGIIERHGEKDGCYRRIDNEIEEVDFLNAPTDEFPLALPLGIDIFCQIYPGNIIIVAGSKSAGKTAFLLNIVRGNMHRHEIVYLNSEMGDTEFRKRLELFDMPLKDWKFRACHRADNFADLITQERKIFIVDFMEVTTDFWKVAQYIQEIHKKLKNGICIIALQKSEAKETGRGGDFSKEKARLYLSLDYLREENINRLKIVDAKAWRTEINPRGLCRNYKLVNGSNFIPDGDWEE